MSAIAATGLGIGCFALGAAVCFFVIIALMRRYNNI